ncbi:MAG: histidine phosphatase family protein [Oscillospiraceae bacterium]|jgi:uncharacterized phosphatase|nr:histidine phosphatase family protein [Oscillospiraceae bacterium]
MKICLVRHGETDWNRAGKLQGLENIPLNAVGEAQAKSVSEFLAAYGKWDSIISSPLKRARKTAEIISAKLGIAVRENDLLRERDYGASSGLTARERKIKFPDGGEMSAAGWEAAESVRGRVVTVLSAITGSGERKNTIIVAHGGVINSALAYVSNGEMGTGKTKLANACVSVLVCDGELKIEFYNKAVC